MTASSRPRKFTGNFQSTPPVLYFPDINTDAAMDNANPTILNVSQLPSRAQKRAPRAGPDSKYDAIVLSHPAWADDLSDSDEFGGGVGEDYAIGDSLDEQEIYGMSPCCNPSRRTSPLPCTPRLPAQN